MPNVIKLGFVGLHSIAMEAVQQHFTEIVGLQVRASSADQVYFSCGADHHALVLDRSSERGFAYVGLQIDGEGPLEPVAAELRGAGLSCDVVSDAFAGVSSCISLTDPDGYRIYLYRSTEAAAARTWIKQGIGPRKIGHLAMYVADAQASCDFYTNFFRFRWSDWIGDHFVFLRCGCDHHAMNFLKAPKPGMFHVAFELRDSAHLVEACDYLSRRKIAIEWGPGRHGPGHNLYTYHRDPDRNIIELFADLDRMSNEALGCWDPRSYHRDTPQRPRVWQPGPGIDLWGPPIPESFRVG